MTSEIPRLHLETVTPFMLASLQTLMKQPALSSFQLAGGTSIALLTGHRQSIDLDLFTVQPFTQEDIAPLIAPFQPLTVKPTRIGVAYLLPAPAGESALKVDLCNWRTRFLYPPVLIDGLRLTDLRDSCADKLNAITDRDELKDVWDIAELLKEFSLPQMVDYYKRKHPFLDAKEPVRALTHFDYNKPVGFRVLNGETPASIRERVETALLGFGQKPVQEKPLIIPEAYRNKLAQKGIEAKEPPAPLKPKRKGPKL